MENKPLIPHWIMQTGQLVYKDLSLQWRNRDALFVVVLFSMLVVLVFAFAYGPFFVPPELGIEARQRELAKLAGSVFWVAVSFAGVIALHRSAEIDRAHGAMWAIRLAGIDPTVLYFGKAISMTVILLIVELLLLPMTIVFLQVDTFRLYDALRFAGIMVLGTAGFSTFGALVAMMTTSARGRESLLAVMLLPLLIPLVIAATKSSVPIFASEPITARSWLGLLGAYPLIALAVGTLLIEPILEE